MNHYSTDPRDITPAEKKRRAKLYAEAQKLNAKPMKFPKATKTK